MMCKRMSGRFTSAPLFLLLAGACGGSSADGAVSSQQLDALSRRLSAVEAFEGEQECGDELRRLLSDARAECRAGSAPSVPADIGSEERAAVKEVMNLASEEDDKCSSDQLRGAIVAAERSLTKDAAAQGQRKTTRVSPIAQMLDRFRCEVLYLDGESESVPQARQAKLADMVQMSQLPQTKYIILASSAGGEVEARHRADVMRRELTELKVDGEKIEKAWIYPFSLQLNQIRKRGLWPKSPAETAELSHAVWVCRTSC